MVTQTDVEDFPQPLLGTGGGHRCHHFHTPGEIAEHPVGRANVKFAIERVCVTSSEMEDPRVLEKASYDGTHANALTAVGNARPEAAYSPYHQVNRDTCAGCFTKRLNDCWVLELVHLGNNARREPGTLVFCLPLDQLQKPRAHRRRRHQKRLALGGLRVSGQVVKEVDDIACQRWIAREEPDVGIQSGSTRVWT